MARVALVLLALAATAARPDASFAQPEPATPQHIVDLWQQSAGLPQNYVFTVIQSRDGYLWIGGSRRRPVEGARRAPGLTPATLTP